MGCTLDSELTLGSRHRTPSRSLNRVYVASDVRIRVREDWEYQENGMARNPFPYTGMGMWMSCSVFACIDTPN